MAASTDLTPVRNARTLFRAARQTLLAALDNVGTTAAALADAQRVFAADRPELAAALAASQAAVAAATAARANDVSARGSLQSAIASWVSGVSVDDDLARLSTATPLLLFPVRIETRFGVDGNNQPVLRVRIYPDEIF